MEVERKKVSAPGRKSVKLPSKFKGGKLVDGIEYDVEARRRRKTGGDGEDGNDDFDYDYNDEVDDGKEADDIAAAARAAAEIEIERAREEEARLDLERKEKIKRQQLEEEKKQRDMEILEQKKKEEEEEEEKMRIEQEKRRIREDEEASERMKREELKKKQKEEEILEKERREELFRRAQLAQEEESRAEQAREEEKRRKEEELLVKKRLEQERAELEQQRQLEWKRRQDEEEAELERQFQAEKARREQLRLEEERHEAEERAKADEEERLFLLKRAQEAQEAIEAQKLIENEELNRKKAEQERQRKKREMFLSDLDNFSESFETQKLIDKEKTEAEILKQQQELDEKLKLQKEKFQSSSIVPLTNDDINITDIDLNEMNSDRISDFQMAKPKRYDYESDHTLSNLTDKIQDNKPRKASEFKDLASSLFANDPSMTSLPVADDKEEVKADEVLRVPTRIGKEGAKKKPLEGYKATSSTAADKMKTSSDPLAGTHRVTVADAISGVYDADLSMYAGGNSDDENDLEGSGLPGGLSCILTEQERKNLNPQQRAAWRALQADLTTRRKDFHGTVTYAFEGIFSWQMYGSAEAVDELGKTYTEYLMRCQWGTTWENMQPWISARRFREFDLLDTQKLPEKDFFRNLEMDVIQRRRAALEDYMVKIVSTMPSLLKSPEFDEFLGITERIEVIKAKIASDASMLQSSYEGGGSVRHPSDALDADIDDCLSFDVAERLREQTQANHLDEDELGCLEEDIRLLGIAVRSATPEETAYGGKIRTQMLAITNRWPRLRATAIVNAGVNFSLIPRAMQAEEDLMRHIDEYRSLRVAHTLVS